MGSINRRLKYGRRERLEYFIPFPSLLFIFSQISPPPPPLLPWALPSMAPCLILCNSFLFCLLPADSKNEASGASTSLVHSFILRIILNSYVKSCCIKVSLLNHLFNSPEWDDRVSSLFTICSYLSSLCNLYDPPQFCLCLILCLPLFQSTNFLFQITYSFELGVTKTFNILSHTLYSLFINLPNLDFQRFSWLIMQ